MKKPLTAFAVIATLLFLAWGVKRTINYVQFEMNCTQYLKRAADANTVELAKEELGKAISYAEENKMTDGIVSIIFHQPKNDVGYWYRNMKEAYNELDNLPENATSLEKTNVLMKLRESLTDEKQSGISVTLPNGISIYPYNLGHFLWGVLSAIFAVGLWIAVMLD